jgi:hypothetical protein
MLRKIGIIAVVSLLVVAMTAAVATAASVHFKGKNSPTFTDNGVTLSASGALAGLGNQDVLITLCRQRGSRRRPAPTQQVQPSRQARTRLK